MTVRATFAALTTAALLATSATAADLKPVISLEHVVGGKVTATATILATGIDPNRSSAGDRFELQVNGQPSTLDTRALARFAHARRGYAYDNFTGGIVETTRKAACRMQGPADGYILKVRYLTYENSKITKDEMRPVFSSAGNCLFETYIHPKKRMSEVEAAKALGFLQALLTR